MGYKTYITASLTAIVGIAGLFGFIADPTLAQQITEVGLAISAIFLRMGMKNP